MQHFQLAAYHVTGKLEWNAEAQSRAQGHFGSLLAVWSPNNDLWEYRIFIPEIVGFQFLLRMSTLFSYCFRLTSARAQNRERGPLRQRKKKKT